jgi:hypothetical protein
MSASNYFFQDWSLFSVNDEAWLLDKDIGKGRAPRDHSGESGVVLFGGQKPEASTSPPKILRPHTNLNFRRF